MFFNAIRENKILAKMSGFTVLESLFAHLNVSCFCHWAYSVEGESDVDTN